MKMIQLTVSSFFLGSLLLIFGNAANAQQGCSVPIKELQAGVYEVDLDNVKVKLEVYNKIAKMKLTSSLNEDWTSVSTEEGIGQISGFIGNGSEAKMISQLVVKQTDNGFDWAIIKLDSDGNSGDAYFSISKATKCIKVDPQRWADAVRKSIGEITNTSAVNLSNDSLAGL